MEHTPLTPEGLAPTVNESPVQTDHMILRDGKSYAGEHHILDMWGPQRINDPEFIEATLKEAVAAARATLLHIHVHTFSLNGGVSGVAVLAESHISVHTWPERGFAAFDIFTCGSTEPEAAIAVLVSAFAPERVDAQEILRGGST
jgi:S-adenosylmethionine decarboxylase